MSLIVETKNLYKSFKTAQYYIPVIRGINLKINKGETLGIVGESGCGKTTLGKLIAGLDTSYIGEIYFNKFPLNLYLKEKFIRSKIQMVFQHPALSLNRRMKIYDTLKEPLKLILQLNSNEIDYRINDILNVVGLNNEYKNKYPGKISGGQQQRIAIARAIIANPDLVVLDEPTSSLDQSIRNKIINLLNKLQKEKKITYIFISHDLNSVEKISDRIAVMYLGRIVEMGKTQQIIENPLHPYTKALLSASPSIYKKPLNKKRIILKGETPNLTNLPVGCSFQDRCSYVTNECFNKNIKIDILKDNRMIECENY